MQNVLINRTDLGEQQPVPHRRMQVSLFESFYYHRFFDNQGQFDHEHNKLPSTIQRYSLGVEFETEYGCIYHLIEIYCPYISYIYYSLLNSVIHTFEKNLGILSTSHVFKSFVLEFYNSFNKILNFGILSTSLVLKFEVCCVEILQFF